MKRILSLMLLCAVIVFTSCEKDEETGPTINIKEIKGKKAIYDSVLITIGNYDGKVEVVPENENFTLEIDTVTIPGVINLRSNTAGTTNIKFICGSKTLIIPATFDKSVTDKMFSDVLLPFGKTVAEVRKLEADRGNTFKGQTDRDSRLTLYFEISNPVPFATEGEEIYYMFDVISEGVYSGCEQVSMYTYYGSSEDSKNNLIAAWDSTTENNFYKGKENSYSHALTRDMATEIFYQIGVFPDGTYGYIAHYKKYTPNKSLKATIKYGENNTYSCDDLQTIR